MQDLDSAFRLQDLEHQLIDYSRSGIIGMDAKGCVRIWNRGAERIFAIDREDVLGKRPEEFFDGDPPFRPGKDARKDEYLYRVKDRELFLNISCSRFLNEDGGESGSSVLVRDVTETVALRQVLEHSERLSHLGKMAAGIAHEVGNPLASISSIVQGLQVRLKEDGVAGERLGMVKDQVSRISTIIRQLSDYSRPQRARSRPTDVNEVIREAARLMRFDERSHGVDLTMKLDERIPLLDIAPHQIQQVFVNLLQNAFDATRDQSFRSLIVQSTGGEGFADFTVQDNGQGLSPDVADKIFDPFFTTKDPGKGTGLGLWICRGIVEALSGRIWVESPPAGGACFHVRLQMKETHS